MISKGSVLVVDDDTGIRDNLKVVLERSGYHVIGASNGKAALNILKTVTFDVMLLDMMMPETNGNEVLKSLPPERPIVIVMTAMSNDAMEKECLANGAIDYVRKPYNVEILMTKIANHILIKRAVDTERLSGILQMARAACHHISQPLTVISGYSSMLLEDKTLNEKTKKRLTCVQNAAIELADLIKKISKITHTRTVPCAPGAEMVDIKVQI